MVFGNCQPDSTTPQSPTHSFQNQVFISSPWTTVGLGYATARNNPREDWLTAANIQFLPRLHAHHKLGFCSVTALSRTLRDRAATITIVAGHCSRKRVSDLSADLMAIVQKQHAQFCLRITGRRMSQDHPIPRWRVHSYHFSRRKCLLSVRHNILDLPYSIFLQDRKSVV